MNFKEIDIEDKPIFEHYFKQSKSIMTERSFTALFLWQKAYNTKFCVKDDMLFIRYGNGNKLAWTVPIGEGNIEKALEEIKLDAKQNGSKPLIWGITEEYFPIFKDFDLTPTRDAFDYIYSMESFKTFAGKKLHSKRNFINRFKKENEGNWEYRNIDFSNIDEIFIFLDRWYSTSNLSDADKHNEKRSIKLALKNAEKLELLGGAIYLNKEMIAFSIASPQNAEAVDVLFEKADTSIVGAYQMIANEFCKNCFGNFKYINREEDLGIEGLRAAKLSYTPLFLTEKYETVIN